MNDVIFQEDPFSINFNEDLYCALEGNSINDMDNHSSMLNRRMIGECSHLPENNNDNYNNAYVICAGTILGNYHGLLKYLEYYINVQKQKMVNDQGLLNVYVYNCLSSKKCLEYKYSKILTLDRIVFETLNIDENKNIINNNGEKYSIVHQIDRCNLSFMLSLVE